MITTIKQDESIHLSECKRTSLVENGIDCGKEKFGNKGNAPF
jgi:hypothetical protein